MVDEKVPLDAVKGPVVEIPPTLATVRLDVIVLNVPRTLLTVRAGDIDVAPDADPVTSPDPVHVMDWLAVSAPKLAAVMTP